VETPVVTWQQVHEAINQLPAEVLPEVAEFIEFMKFKTQQKPQGHQLSSAESDQQALRAALIDETCGMFADLPTRSEEYARRKQDDIDLEDRVR
jgi:hypothetical protein